MYVKFLKSTMFRGKIQTNAEKGLKENILNWLSLVKELGFMETKPKP